MKKKSNILLFFACLALLALLAAVRSPSPREEEQYSAKPVIYLYPEEQCGTEPVVNLYPEAGALIHVELDYSGTLTCTYPAYDAGWTVLAQPDGTLIDPDTGETYSYLFWEGVDGTEYDLSQGFVVPGGDTADFLRSVLAELGLTPREYNEFIVYWLPKMQDNPYNLITFQTTDYTEHAALTIDPAPDSLLRVFMVWQALEEPVELEEPELEGFERRGFTVVEWGGCEYRAGRRN